MGRSDTFTTVLLRCLIALVSGAVLAAAFEPIGWSVLLVVGVAGLFGAVRGLGPGRAWLPGLLFGASFCYLVMVWMRPVGTDAWLAMSGVEALFFAPLGSALAVAHRSRWWPVWCAVMWTAVESVRAVWPFSGMPFGRLAFATADTLWEGWLPWVGMTGVTFIVALTAGTALWLLLTARRRPARATAVALLAAALTASLPVVGWDFQPAGSATVAAVQGNVPGDGTDVVGNHRQITQDHVRLTHQLADDVRAGEVGEPDFVVWPENSTAVDPFTDVETNLAIRGASAAVDVPLVVGGMVDGTHEREILNQSIVWYPERGGGDRYTKMHPVPYGEYIPFRTSGLLPSDYGRLREVARDMSRGTRTAPLRVGDIQVAAGICFDVAYDDGISQQVRSGGEIVMIQTSNAMFIHTGQIDQQFEITRLRAVEASRWTVVAAINGVSGVIAPTGEVVAMAAPRTAEVLVEEVQLSSAVTPAMRLAPWLPRLAVGVAVVHLLWVLVAYRVLARRRIGVGTSPETGETVNA